MLLKVSLFVCLLGLVYGQIDFDLVPNNTCAGTYFYFWNGQQQLRNQLWDWETDNFDDGASDTFDNFFYLNINADGASIDFAGDIAYLVNSSCEPGSKDPTSYGYASTTYDYSSVMVRRTYYAPRSSSWMRIIDTFQNPNSTVGAPDLHLYLNYYGELGSDSGTWWINVNDYYSVSSDELNGSENEDAPLTVNWAGPGAQIMAIWDNGTFANGNDEPAWAFNLTIPAGEKRSIMHVLAQHSISHVAVSFASKLAAEVPAEINEMMDADVVSTVVNWDLCTVQWKVVSPASAFCSNPAELMLEGSADASITVNGNTYTTSGRQVSIPGLTGTTTISYTRSAPGCAAKTADIEITLPAATLAASVDTSGTLPSVSATGGTSPYSISWTFPTGGNLASAFGSKATVVVMDANKCMTTVDVDLPASVGITPSTGAPVKVNSPGKASSGSQIGATFVGVAALLALF